MSLKKHFEASQKPTTDTDTDTMEYGSGPLKNGADLQISKRLMKIVLKVPIEVFGVGAYFFG